MISKKMGIAFVCLMAISIVIEISFRQSAIAHLIARAIPLVFIIYFLTEKDFKTKYPKIVGIRPQMIIILVVIIALTIYEYLVK
jgi:4-amino-4-deoxy-L-arabinose transferase-like glycosyltransferase